MTQKEMEIFVNLLTVLDLLPDSKKEFLLGYVEGVLAMASKSQVSVEQTE